MHDIQKAVRFLLRHHSIHTFFFFFGILFIFPFLAHSEVTQNGGYAERFRGRGDRVPPLCGFDIPGGASEPFFVKWYCEDDYTDSQDIRSELWLYRDGASRGVLLENFLGFPAAAFIDQSTLQVTKFSEGFPVSFRLVARDKAGNEVITPLRTVFRQDNGVDKCSVQIQQTVTDTGIETTTGSSTSTSIKSVIIDNAMVTSSQSAETSLHVLSSPETSASTCEIESICGDGTGVTFEMSLTFDEAGTSATGTFSLNPGDVAADVAGKAQVNEAILSQVDVSAETFIDDNIATVEITCSQESS